MEMDYVHMGFSMDSVTQRVCMLCPIHVLATSGHHGSSGPGTDVPNSFTVHSPVFAACFVSMAAIRCAVFRSSS